jgi:hypothetical protein
MWMSGAQGVKRGRNAKDRKANHCAGFERKRLGFDARCCGARKASFECAHGIVQNVAQVISKQTGGANGRELDFGACVLRDAGSFVVALGIRQRWRKRGQRGRR